MADYSKQKSGKPQKNRPPHKEHNEPGGPANPFGNRNDKAALLERMKANAQKAKADEPDEPVVRPEGEA
ncbi:hypothetical protein FHG66_02305 [Rubellimicrobium rubrum]|uniref:Uncharacterized protein n=1 Tax=Rubellimicrobium rubrum TaxID=2585369 RepID=A0A5C4N614_9RHOB|nr:hypothetical protein [Rubellimicrobium rubrum]TNC52394.1 hypothetical protein FHG66_02305 [Rubellimicrobium rubrum]